MFRAYHTAVSVFPNYFKNNPKFNIFFMPEKRAFTLGHCIKIPGVYIFGGVDKNHKLTNSLKVLCPNEKHLECFLKDLHILNLDTLT